MTVWCCSEHAMRIAKLPLTEWAGQIEALPDACEKICGAPRSCRQQNANYLRVQYMALQRAQGHAATAAVKRGQLL